MTCATRTLRTAGAAALMLTSATALHAQLASASAAAFGMGDNYTALARGYNAVSWNPAGLGMTGNPDFSLTIGSARGIAGLDPVTLSDLKEYEGQVVPTNVKQQWLNSIIAEESQAGTGGADLTWLALQIGPVAVQAATSGRAVNNISPGVAQLIMFGNADDTGPQAITLSGSAVDVNSYTTFAASFGMPFSIAVAAGRLAAGATVKYTMGHVLAFGRESTGATTTQPVAVNFSFPIVHTPLGDDDESFEVNNGNGFGLDIGVGYEEGPLTLAATVQNLFNTFEWDDTALRYRPLSIVLAQGSYETETDVQPIATAPQALQDAVDDMGFKPSLALGAAFRQSARLNIAADARFGGSEGMHTRPPTHVGAGIEYAVASFLPVRVGVAYVKVDDENSGFQFGGGFGIRFGSYNLSAGIGQVNTDLGKDTHLMLQVVSFGM